MNYFFFYFYLFSYYYFRQKYKNITYNYLGRDNMKDLFIENYINSLSINDLKNYAYNNNIELSDNDAKTILDMGKKYWKVVYYGDPSHVFNMLKKKINENTFNEVLKLYNMYIKRK